MRFHGYEVPKSVYIKDMDCLVDPTLWRTFHCNNCRKVYYLSMLVCTYSRQLARDESFLADALTFNFNLFNILPILTIIFKIEILNVNFLLLC